MSGTIEVGIATRALPAQATLDCGDLGFCFERGGRRLVGLIDGLGHGEHASDIAIRACTEVGERPDDEPLDQMFEALIQAFRGDRGFVAAICRPDPDRNVIEFCGIGNISSRLFTTHETTLLSGPGIIGLQSARPKPRTLDFPTGSLLVLHTDGISSHLRAEELRTHLGTCIDQAAQALLDAHARPNDDAGVVLVRHSA